MRQYVYRKQEDYLTELKRWESSKSVFFDVQTTQRQVQIPPIQLPPEVNPENAKPSEPTTALFVTSSLILTAYNKAEDARYVYVELVKEITIQNQAELDALNKELVSIEDGLKTVLRKELPDFDKIKGIVE